MTNPEVKLPLAVIAGPTASGKTALALHLAQSRDVTIINADSAQVYAELPILSAQPTAAEMVRAPHMLFGTRYGAQACSAADWAEDAKRAIADAHVAGRLPVLVGGTGLYIRTLLDGIAPIPDIDGVLRRDIRAMDTANAYARLVELDAASAAALNPADDSRIKRALEVITQTGRSILDWRTEKTGGIGVQISLKPLLLLPPRDWLHGRCDVRFDLMMAEGAVDEVDALLARGLPDDAPVMRAIGVREIAAMLKGEISREEAVLRGKAATRQYAKRQYTWFNNQSPADWPRWKEEISSDNMDKIEILLQ